MVLDAAGNFAFDTTFALDGSADGVHTIALRATDVAGNVSALNQTTIELDTQITVPVIEVTEHATGDTLTHGDVTSATLLVLGGTGDPGSNVTLNEATLGVIGTATVDGTGSWVIDASGTNFAEGTYSFTATAQDDAGNTSVASDGFVVQVDTTPPDVSLDIAPVGVITNTNLTITGDVSDPTDVALLEAQIDGGAYFVVTLQPDGTFSFDTTFALDGTDDGLHTVRVRATDPVNNVSDPVEATFELDTQIAAPVIVHVDQDTGVSNADQITHDATLILTGTAEAHSTVTVSEAALGVIGAATTDALGAWSLDATATVLAEGSHSFTATATDEAGNTSVVSAALVVQVDVTDPTVSIDSPVDGLVTNTNVTVTGVADDTFLLDQLEAQIDGGSGGAFFAVAVQPDGSYSFDTTFALDGTDDGLHTVTLRATDVAGNVSSLTQVTWTLDTQVAVPSITAISQDTGVNNSDAVTHDTTLVLTGTAEAHSTVTVSEAAIGVIGTATSDALGAWSLDATATILDEGSHSFTATATDLAGNASGPSAAFAVQIDVTDPTVSIDTPVEGLITNTNVTVTGIAGDEFALDKLEAQLDGGSGGVFVNVTVQPDGSYIFDTTLALDGSDDGSYTIRVRTTDAAGNVSSLTERSFLLDTQIVAPVIVDFTQDTGDSSTDGITSDTRLVFTGTAEPDSTVTLSEATLGVIGSAAVDGLGQWAVDGTETILADGTYTFTATAQDLAGNVSVASVPLTVQVDTAAPGVVINNPTPGSPGLVTETNVTVDGQVLDLTDAVLLEAQINDSSGGSGGTWLPVAFDPTTGLYSFDTTLALDGTDNGIYTVQVRVTDVAGNESVPVETSFTLAADVTLVETDQFHTAPPRKYPRIPRPRNSRKPIHVYSPDRSAGSTHQLPRSDL